MHSCAPCQCKNGAAAFTAGQKFLRMQGAGRGDLAGAGLMAGPRSLWRRLSWRARRSAQAGRPGERLSPASGPLRSARPEETRRQKRRGSDSAAAGPLHQYKGTGHGRSKARLACGGRKPPRQARPACIGQEQPRQGPAVPGRGCWRRRRITGALGAFRAGAPWRIERPGGLRYLLRISATGLHPSYALSRRHTGVCAAACRVRLFASAPAGLHAPPLLPEKPAATLCVLPVEAAPVRGYAVQGDFTAFSMFLGKENATYHVVLFYIFQITLQDAVPDDHFCARNIDKPINGV